MGIGNKILRKLGASQEGKRWRNQKYEEKQYIYSHAWLAQAGRENIEPNVGSNPQAPSIHLLTLNPQLHVHDYSGLPLEICLWKELAKPPCSIRNIADNISDSVSSLAT